MTDEEVDIALVYLRAHLDWVSAGTMHMKASTFEDNAQRAIDILSALIKEKKRRND